MSLPPLLKHIYNYGTEEVIRRGKKIFLTSGVQLLDFDHLGGQVRFRVRNDLYQNYYTVTVANFTQPQNLSVRCQCPYNLGEICRHEVGALFQLNDMVHSGFFDNTDVQYNQKHTIVRLKMVTRQLIQVYASTAAFELAEKWVNENKVQIVQGKDDTLEAIVDDGQKKYPVLLKQNDERQFDTSCDCQDLDHPLCAHKVSVFLQVLSTHGAQYFQTMRNWDEQKNKLLRLYGFSLEDDLTNKFTFTYENGKPFLRVLDPTIKKLSALTTPILEKKEPEIIENQRLGIVFTIDNKYYPYVHLQLITGKTNEDENAFLGGIEKLELSQYINAAHFKEMDRELIPIIRKFSGEEVMKYFKKNLPFGDFLGDYHDVLRDEPNHEIKEQVWEFLLPKFQKLLNRFSVHSLCYLLPANKVLTSKNISSISFAPNIVHPVLKVSTDKDLTKINLFWELGHVHLSFEEVKMLNAGLLVFEEAIYCVGNIHEVFIVEHFLPDGCLEIPSTEWAHFLERSVMDWSKHIKVEFSPNLMENVVEAQPKFQLYLQEREQMLLLLPVFNYNDISVKWGSFGDVIKPNNGKVLVIHRNEELEEQFLQMLRRMHSEMQQNNREHFLYLHASAVLSNNWFFRFLDEIKEWQVELFGFEGLKNLRINQFKPETKIVVSNGIDWFDAQVEIAFGDQKVTIAEVKRALAQKMNYVKLGDGSMGILPEEWLKKYSLLMKMGEAKNGKLRLRKIHFSALDELMAEVDEDSIVAELEEKKLKLNNIIDQDYSSLNPPSQLKATLRPYQQAGFQWLAFLNEAKWGGILADDMGLGKTVQALTFLQYYKNSHPIAKFLVVCPTTLMYNWENEVKKFTPELKHHIHHGPKRSLSSKVLHQFDIIITSYGTMRSDIKLFNFFEFDYVVLDESQAIKNPQSQVTKAAQLINAKNKLALSGTPVQNNTFDLFAQMNFLNPGLLGSREFFMNEFATPIDKFQEADIKEQLRKLIYPFLLRRTKEQVAKDLPEKTESILYCEMGKEQRKIYDAYRNTYKDQILGMIDERGIERSTMHILSGLTKLRQICDSPAILNEEEKFDNYSIKLEELMREITENVGNHKALVFSQFLGMLALMREHLEAAKIPYVYFDGSSTSTEREKAIQQFQGDDSTRVFLISLKAGGVGLNLTAADYVYIVDPWWNPAVEQQAIDRTHRIGQTKNIFAYRLICKDTIEEKMLLLQERKRALAQDLVADDSAFLKKLTREDIAYLLS